MSPYRLRFDPELLATFLAAADVKTISGASQVLHLSQPAVTAQIRKLENALGTQLFRRSVKGVSLTTAGSRLYSRARHIHSLLDQAALDVGRLQAGRGMLVLAASTTIAAHVLPPVLAAFKRRHRDVDILIDVGNTDQVLRKVLSGAAPLGLVEGFARAASVRLERYVDDEIVLVGPREAAPKIRHLRDLQGHDILWREPGSGTRAVVEGALRRAGFPARGLKYSLQFGSTEAIKCAVIEGLGVAFVSRWAIQNECALGKIAVLPLADFSIPRRYYWTLPSGALSSLAHEFYRFANHSRPSLTTKR